jgi:hypothetical protein
MCSSLMKDNFADILMWVESYILSGLGIHHSMHFLLLEFLLKNLLLIWQICLYMWLFAFSLITFNILSLSYIFTILTIICLWVFFFNLACLVFWKLPYWIILFLSKLGKFSAIFFIKYVFYASFLTSLLVIHRFGHLMVSHRSWMLHLYFLSIFVWLI